jgi:hypothetical protein
MKEIRVECYAGYRADQKSLRLAIRGRLFDVRDVDDRTRPEPCIFACRRMTGISTFFVKTR